MHSSSCVRCGALSTTVRVGVVFVAVGMYRREGIGLKVIKNFFASIDTNSVQHNGNNQGNNMLLYYTVSSIPPIGSYFSGVGDSERRELRDSALLKVSMVSLVVAIATNKKYVI